MTNLNLTTNAEKSQSTSFLFINPLPETRAKLTVPITGVERPCPKFSMRLGAVDRPSHTLDTAQQNYSPVRSTEFSIPIRTQDADHLLLTIDETGQTRDRGSLTVSNLNITAN